MPWYLKEIDYIDHLTHQVSILYKKKYGANTR